MAKTATPIQNINALAELERAGWKFEPVSESEVRMCCPVHDDSTPSLDLNVKKNLFQCHASGCKAHGDIVSLLAFIYKTERSAMLIELAKTYDLDTLKVINPTTVEKFCLKIKDAGPLLQALYERGLTDQDIRERKIGVWDGRLTIPIYDIKGNVVNIRRYLPGAPGNQKMRNTAGYGKIRVYMPEQLGFDTVWMCGGECKAIVAARLLNPHGIGAVSLTAGEGEWDPELSKFFKGKRMYVVMDVDKAGRMARHMTASQLYYVASRVYTMTIPLDPKTYPKGDINDWVGREGAEDTDLLKLMDKAEQWSPPEEVQEAEKASEVVKLVDATSSSNMNKRIEFNCVIPTMDTTPYLVPRRVGVHCDRNQANCPFCRIKLMEVDPDTGYTELTISGTSPGILEIVKSGKGVQRDGVREALRIPLCKSVEFQPRDFYTVSDVRVATPLSLTNEGNDCNVKPVPAWTVGTTMPEHNTPYTMRGRVFPNPRDQQAILLVDEFEQSEDSLSSFKPPRADLEALQLFTPNDWTVESIEERLDAIYKDLEANVTRIFCRRELHLAMDLAYHSALLINFDGQLTKGWTNVLIIGDSSQGKSETAERFIEHFGLGDRMECKNASKAGLLGGLQMMGTRWFISWGKVPLNDTRLLVLEEVKGASTEILGTLTDMRSSGIAEVGKIEKGRAHARTRLVFISNPRGDREVSSYNFGVETIKELIGGLEDVRRFDLAVIVSRKQIDPKEINRLSKDRPVVDHRHTSELCHRLVLWAWTRKPEQISFESDAVDRILEAASELCSVYSESLPLVDRGTMRHKLARLAVAIAIRTFSTDDTLQNVYVRKCHVDYIVGFLNRLYSNPIFGYADFSQAQIHATSVIDPKLVERYLKTTKYPRDFIQNLLYTDDISLTDICDWCEVDREAGQAVLSFLVRKHAIYRIKRGYVKTSEFIGLLKSIDTSGVPTTATPDTKDEM